MEDINILKNENEELKKKFDLFKIQVQERDEDLTKIKEEFHQNKRNHHE